MGHFGPFSWLHGLSESRSGHRVVVRATGRPISRGIRQKRHPEFQIVNCWIPAGTMPVARETREFDDGEDRYGARTLRRLSAAGVHRVRRYVPDISLGLALARASFCLVPCCVAARLPAICCSTPSPLPLLIVLAIDIVVVVVVSRLDHGRPHRRSGSVGRAGGRNAFLRQGRRLRGLSEGFAGFFPT